MSKQKKIKSFDPNSPASGEGNIFGLPFTTDEAELVLIPVPWDVTVSYSDGTSKGPKAIFDASSQVDLFDPLVKDAWKIGIAMEEISKDISKKNSVLRKIAAKYIGNIEKGVSIDSSVMKKIRRDVNKGCEELRQRVKKIAKEYLNRKKLVGLVGGDHSTPLGLIEALSEKHSSFGILQIDAHCDLRKAYEGFEYSHASIMYNALKNSAVKKLVQVGIRDWCEEENNYISSSKGRVKTFFDFQLKEQLYRNRGWASVCGDIIQELPKHVYISFDIDGLDPKLCPNTGTPVPGGLEFEQAVFLMEMIAMSGKKIIGFDLNEVAPGKDPSISLRESWNGNVGARMLFRMCNLAAASNGMAKFNQ